MNIHLVIVMNPSMATHISRDILLVIKSLRSVPERHFEPVDDMAVPFDHVNPVYFGEWGYMISSNVGPAQ